MVALEGEPVRWDGELAVRWDADAAELQRGRVRGPARVTFNVPVELHGLQARPAADGQRVTCSCWAAGTVLEVRP